MNKTKIILLLLLLVTLCSPGLSQARGVKRVKISVKRVVASAPIVVTAHAEDKQTQEQKPEKVSCNYDKPTKVNYSGEFIAVRRKTLVGQKELFEVKVFIQNTGNTPWFSADSGCGNGIVNLGTDKDRDRQSPFFVDNLIWKSNWLGKNRIKMESKRVDPGQIATFGFWSQAPAEDGYYREYYTPVAEGKTWIDGGTFHTDTTVGQEGIDPAKKDLFQYFQKSTNLAKIDLSGEKQIEVDLSSQRMNLKIGDYVIRNFPVSTGKSKTPTPPGVTKIIEKREVRVAAGSTHWIMPKWMMFRKGGYGIHALPSLANDHGVYWREALAHIGSPRSHGCIRLLPKDAEFAYNFAEVGTKVVVHY
jgi:lipoprotein-anchoring transpeptidase ErfK/SrfK